VLLALVRCEFRAIFIRLGSAVQDTTFNGFAVTLKQAILLADTTDNTGQPRRESICM
jgi:hypothetical protein